MAPFSFDPANQPFVVTAGFYMISGPWLDQAGGTTCTCPCPVEKHPYLGLIDCAGVAQSEYSEQALRDAQNAAATMVSTFLGDYHANRANAKEALKISNGLPPIVFPGQGMTIPEDE